MITNEAILKADELKIKIDRLKYLDSFFKKWITDDLKPSVVFTAMKHGVPIFEGVYGDSMTDTPLSMDTIFPVMSVTKPVISILLHILQEDGLVDLVEPVKSYLPSFKGGGRDEICLWHLLTHTSGFDDEEMDEYFKNYLKCELGIEALPQEHTHEQWLSQMKEAYDNLGLSSCESEDGIGQAVYKHIIEKMPLQHKPRERMSYNGYGYDLARDVICAVTGESIDSFAKRVLFDPLGMKNSYWKLPEEKWNRVVGRNEKCSSYEYLTSENCFKSESAGGGLKTTAPDFIKFLEMLRRGGEYAGVRILSPASVRSITTNHNADLPNYAEFDSWGLGFNVLGYKKDDSGMLCNSTTITHAGYAGCQVLVDFENGLSYAFFSVQYTEPAVFYRSRVTNILLSAML